MMSVRVKGVTEIQLEAAKEYLDYQILHKSLYNFLFWLDMDEKHYCTDLVSRAYQNAFYPLEEQKNIHVALMMMALLPVLMTFFSLGKLI